MTAPQDTYARNAQCVDVCDGDTVKLDIDLGHGIWIHRVPVRLARIDTPELRSTDQATRRRATEAQAFTFRHLVTAVRVVVQTRTRDKYGRWLAEVWCLPERDGAWVNLSDALLAANLAVPYTD